MWRCLWCKNIGWLSTSSNQRHNSNFRKRISVFSLLLSTEFSSVHMNVGKTKVQARPQLIWNQQTCTALLKVPTNHNRNRLKQVNTAFFRKPFHFERWIFSAGRLRRNTSGGRRWNARNSKQKQTWSWAQTKDGLNIWYKKEMIQTIEPPSEPLCYLSSSSFCDPVKLHLDVWCSSGTSLCLSISHDITEGGLRWEVWSELINIWAWFSPLVMDKMTR